MNVWLFDLGSNEGILLVSGETAEEASKLAQDWWKTTEWFRRGVNGPVHRNPLVPMEGLSYDGPAEVVYFDYFGN